MASIHPFCYSAAAGALGQSYHIRHGSAASPWHRAETRLGGVARRAWDLGCPSIAVSTDGDGIRPSNSPASIRASMAGSDIIASDTKPSAQRASVHPDQCRNSSQEAFSCRPRTRRRTRPRDAPRPDRKIHGGIDAPGTGVVQPAPAGRPRSSPAYVCARGTQVSSPGRWSSDTLARREAHADRPLASAG